MVLSRHPIVIHPNTLRCIEQALARICTFTVTEDPEGAKVFEIAALLNAELTHEQRKLLMIVNGVRFIPVAALPTEPLNCDPVRSMVKPAVYKDLQGLRKFLKHGWGAR